jgi:hypothetical protein
MHQPHADRRRQPAPLALDSLQSLPCGCVVAVYHAQPLNTAIVSMEARGPHCLHGHHVTGRIVGLSTEEEDRPGR